MFILALGFWLAMSDIILFRFRNVDSTALKLWQPVLKRDAY